MRKYVPTILFLLTVIVVALILLAYKFPNAWTGFHNYQPNPATFVPGKTLWDWLDLLIIPAVLALGAFWVNWMSQKNEQKRADRENQVEREIAAERNQEAALQAYLDRMTELLLKERLRTSEPEDEERTVARTRTLTILRSLSAERKSAVARFLIEAKLVTVVAEPEQVLVVSLLEADLSGADLSEANLSRADLREAT